MSRTIPGDYIVAWLVTYYSIILEIGISAYRLPFVSRFFEGRVI
jgi:hypothetical protein